MHKKKTPNEHPCEPPLTESATIENQVNTNADSELLARLDWCDTNEDKLFTVVEYESYDGSEYDPAAAKDEYIYKFLWHKDGLINIEEHIYKTRNFGLLFRLTRYLSTLALTLIKKCVQRQL